MQKLIDFFKDKEGVTAVEYAIMVMLIATVIITTVTVLGQVVSGFFNPWSEDFKKQRITWKKYYLRRVDKHTW